MNNGHNRLSTLLLLWWVAAVYIGLSAGILFACLVALSIIIHFLYPFPHDPLSDFFFSGGWLLLPFILCLLAEVVFTRFTAHRIRRAFGAEEWRAQRRLASLCGLPFYVLGLFCLIMSIPSKDAINASAFGAISHMVHSLIYVIFARETTTTDAFRGLSGLFGLASIGYLMLIRFFLRFSTTERVD